MARSKKVSELHAQLKDSNKVAEIIKKDIDTHEGPTWSKNQKIRRYNEQVRKSKAIQSAIVNEMASFPH